MGDLTLVDVSSWAGDPVSVALAPSSETAQMALGPAEALDLAVRLGRELAEAWRRGERLQAERFFARHPELADHLEAVSYLIRQEILLRRELGVEVLSVELTRRFPGQRAAIVAQIDQDYPDRPIAPAPPPPGVGEMLGEFRLVKVLGRGVRGCVFLAVQPGLADRPVVLKVTPREGREHLSLAGLQHTHIVPLLWAQDLAERRMRVLCMPYLGGTSLSSLLSHVQALPPASRTGRSLLAGLDRIQAASPFPAPDRGPARTFLARASHVQAVCWFGACLADALHHAHERGLVHLDLKPSNVLIAADGLPMLLDFHLARDPMAAGIPATRCLGGTTGFMAPEQARAVVAARTGRLIPDAVDGRADIFALGVLLYSALGGTLPIASDAEARRRLLRLPGVTRGLTAILARCLAEDPSKRYSSAALLAADLRCHLADLPLRGVADRSPAERWSKWRRRHPRALAKFGRAVAVSGLMLGMAALLVNDARRTIDGAEAALAEGRKLLDSGQFQSASRALERGRAASVATHGLIRYHPRARSLTALLDDELRRVRRAGLAEDLHALADRLRFLLPEQEDAARAADLRRLAARLRTAWEARGRIAGQAEGLGAEAGRRLKDDLLDLALIWADLRVRLAAPSEARAARRAALSVLDEAEAFLGPVPALDRERRHHAEALGLTEVARAAGARADLTPPATAWEHFALGRYLQRSGDLEGAAREFATGIELDPRGIWPHFYLGVNAFRLGRPEEAAHAFDVCIALSPRSAECYYNRARARALLNRTDQALRDYDRALELDPTMPAAHLDRGVLLLRVGRAREAILAFQEALRAGMEPAIVDHNLELARKAQDDRASAGASASLRPEIDAEPPAGHRSGRRQ